PPARLGRQPLLRLRRLVAQHDPEPARGDFARHRRAHPAEPDEADLLRHAWPPTVVRSSTAARAALIPSTAAGMPQYTDACSMSSRSSSAVTPFDSAPRRWMPTSCARLDATSIARVTRLRVLRS